MTLNLRHAAASTEFERIVDTGFFSDAHNATYRTTVKRILDIVLVLLAGLPVLLVVMVLCVLIARDGASPFYFQTRVGRNGKTFRMWKLRSMVPNAEALLEAHLSSDPRARIEWEVTQKLKRDPRITAIGRVIRKSSLDELPQLFNVLKGDMSLVGPRPMLPEQRAIYPGLAYYALRPGITGFWQTSVRNEANFAERAKFDTSYFRELGLMTDLRVMARTVKVVARGTGY